MPFSIPFFKKKEKKFNYFCLYITDSLLSGFVLDLQDGKEVIIASRKQSLTSGYDKLLEDIDTLISEIELQSKVRLEKTIFFLNSNMIDSSTHDIKNPYKDQIKKICKELELEPLGYIDLKESMEDYIKSKGISNCTLIELNKAEVGVFVYRSGALVTSKYVPRTQQIGSDISGALTANAGNTILPTKMLIYGEADDAKAVADIAQYNWDEKLFVQHPTIETLKDDELNITLAHSFAKELQQDAAGVPETETTTVGTTAVTGSVPTEESQEAAPTAATANSFGFMVGEDVLKDEHITPETEAAAKETSSKPKAKNKMGDAMKSISSAAAKSGAALKNKGTVGMAAGVLALFLVFMGYEYFFHKTTLKVYVQSKKISEKLDITLPISESSKNSEVSLIKHTSVMDFSDEKNTTGAREEGEKAKGNVVIHNFDNSERTFQRGTELVYDNLRFVLDSEIKVASSSGVTSDGTKQSGKADAAVTAEEIGKEYNLDKGTQLSIDSLPDSLFLAIVDSAFTGGSKKNVNTVSKQDIDSLETAVSKLAKTKSKDQLAKEVNKDEILLPELTDVTLADASYTKEVGEEADVLGIKASSEIEYYTVNKKGLSTKLKEELDKENTDDYELDEKSIEFSVDDVDADKDEATLTLETQARLSKKLDTNALVSRVTMKSISSLSSFLKEEFPVTDVKVESGSINIPLLNSWTPLFKKNITVVITSN